MDALSEAAFEVEGKRALVFGTGGAARAVVFILNWLRASKIYVSGRNSDQAKSISTTFSGEVLEMSSLPGRLLPVDIVVNATSVSSSEESPEMADVVRHLEVSDCRLVFDLNYGRRTNFWQEMAERKGIHFMDGLSALAFQARRTFALWTGLQVPPEEFIRALKEN
jgi:shikimate dehydrogenase